MTLIETLVLLKLYYHERVIYNFNCCLSRHTTVIKQLRCGFKFKFNVFAVLIQHPLQWLDIHGQNSLWTFWNYFQLTNTLCFRLLAVLCNMYLSIIILRVFQGLILIDKPVNPSWEATRESSWRILHQRQVFMMTLVVSLFIFCVPQRT